MTTHLVTTLKRQATQILHQVQKTKTPVLITEYGKPAAYIIDAESFHDQREKMILLEKIARGEKAIKEKRTMSDAAARKVLKKWAV